MCLCFTDRRTCFKSNTSFTWWIRLQCLGSAAGRWSIMLEHIWTSGSTAGVDWLHCVMFCVCAYITRVDCPLLNIIVWTLFTFMYLLFLHSLCFIIIIITYTSHELMFMLRSWVFLLSFCHLKNTKTHCIYKLTFLQLCNLVSSLWVGFFGGPVAE